MDYLAIAVLSFVGGAICIYYGLDKNRRRLEEQRLSQEAMESRLRSASEELGEKQRTTLLDLALKQQAFDEQHAKLSADQERFNAAVISYQELSSENQILKRDLTNLEIAMRKLRVDVALQRDTQEALDQRVQDLGGRYLKENVKWIGASLNPNNFVTCKQRLIDVIQRCRGIGLEITASDEASYLLDLRKDYERVVKIALEREEQARIKAQIREEQQREREVQRERERAERERFVLEEALARALAETRDQHSAEIEALRARLAEAEAKERAISQAQLTKAGFVYVISNIGSFGEGVFKIGMTRRLEPLDRVRELGDASVPFPFDVHLMISCEDAPALENAIHRKLLRQQVNKMNPRKEFFRAEIESIVQVVREHHGEVEYTADPEALQYRQSLTMSEEDQQFIEHVFDEMDDSEAADEELSEPVFE